MDPFSVPPSPAGAYFFLVQKDISLDPCIGYCELNSITFKNRNPRPLISEIFDPVHGAKHFSKLDPGELIGTHWNSCWRQVKDHF